MNAYMVIYSGGYYVYEYVSRIIRSLAEHFKEKAICCSIE